MDLREFDRKQRKAESKLPKTGLDVCYIILFPDDGFKRIWALPEPGAGPVVLEYRKVNGQWVFSNYKYS